MFRPLMEATVSWTAIKDKAINLSGRSSLAAPGLPGSPRPVAANSPRSRRSAPASARAGRCTAAAGPDGRLGRRPDRCACQPSAGADVRGVHPDRLGGRHRWHPPRVWLVLEPHRRALGRSPSRPTTSQFTGDAMHCRARKDGRFVRQADSVRSLPGSSSTTSPVTTAVASASRTYLGFAWISG